MNDETETTKYLAGGRRFASAEGPRVVEAGWLDRFLRRKKYQELAEYSKDFQKELGTKYVPTGTNDIGEFTSEVGQGLYNPTMTSKNRTLQDIQEGLAERAHEGGIDIGPGKQSYNKPVQNIGDVNGLKVKGIGLLGNGLMSKIAQKLAGGVPKIAAKLTEERSIGADIFSVKMKRYHGAFNSEGKPTRLGDPTAWKEEWFDLHKTPPLAPYERGQQDPTVMNLVKSKTVSAEQILAWHDQKQQGIDLPIRSGANAPVWSKSLANDLGQTLAADAARVGRTNFLIDIVSSVSTFTSMIGFVAAVGMAGVGMANINPTDQQTAMPQNSNPYAAPSSQTNDPSQAFQQSSQSSQGGQGGQATGTAAPVSNRPFGAVNQNFGNFSTPAQNGGAVGAIPNATGVPQNAPANPNDPYAWTRVNAAAGRVLVAQSTQMSQPVAPVATQAATPDDGSQFMQLMESALHGAPTDEQITKAFNSVLSLGDTPAGHQKLVQLLESLGQFAPQIERFDSEGQIAQGQETQAPQQTQVTASRQPRFAGRSDGVLNEAVGYGTLDNNFSGTSAFLNPYGTQYNSILQRAQNDPQFATWLHQNPEYAQGINPETSSYVGGGAESAQTYRQVDPNENWEQELQRDLQMMNGGNYQQWEAAQPNVQNQIADHYGNSQLTDAYGNPVGSDLQNTYNTVNPQGAQPVPQYDAWNSQPQGNPAVGPLPQHNNWAQGQAPQYTPPQPTYKWMPGPNGSGTWVPNSR